MSGWTEEHIMELKALWGKGLSGSRIARILRMSRSAVLGKVGRLKLPPRSTTRSAHPCKVAPKPAVPPPEPKPGVTIEPPLTLKDGSRVTPITINDRMCHWPYGDPLDTGFHYCGRQAKAGKLYCEGHDQKMHEPRQKLKRSEHAYA